MQRAEKRAGLMDILICLTVLLVFVQSCFFFVHFQGGSIIDSLSKTSVGMAITLPVVYKPVLYFLFMQVVVYAAWVTWMWFVVVSLGELFLWSHKRVYWAGVLFWCLSVTAMYGLNAYYYPHSYFASFLSLTHFPWWLSLNVLVLLAATGLAYFNFIWFKQFHFSGVAIAMVVVIVVLLSLLNTYRGIPAAKSHAQPNVIIIGLDSLRPDYLSYFGSTKTSAPHINAFLQSSSVFEQAYTPLARTFPSWVTMLTGKHPLHNQARVNLIDNSQILKQDNLAKRLQQRGYFTIYGSDEPRFTDITKAYGFNRIVTPPGGAAEMLLGGINDFPLTNLLVNVSIGKFLFPYSYGNRSADVTYEPSSFLKRIKSSLMKRPDSPIFLAVHLCLSHWPYYWGKDGLPLNTSESERYRYSIESLDAQLSQLMTMLSSAGLLEHSIVVLMSDHGVTMGLPGDRLLTENKFRGNPANKHRVTVNQLAGTPKYTLNFKEDYSVSTSTGQGSDVLSEKQYRVVLAMKGYGVQLPFGTIKQRSSLMDVAPTLLDLLGAKPLSDVDGVSVKHAHASKPLYVETGDKIAAIEKSDIQIEEVLQQAASAYEVDRKTGLLRVTPLATQNINANKQRAIYDGDWLFARYPAEQRMKIQFDAVSKQGVLVPITLPSYDVLVNLKTGEWTTDMQSAFAHTAPLASLKRQLREFYKGEV